MNGVRVRDLVPEGYLACDVRDFLALLGPAGENSEWELSDVWATGDRSDELERLSDEKCRIAGTLLLEMSASVNQVIDGEFRGYEHGAAEAWVVVRAIDSTYYEFFCRDLSVLDKVRERFRGVTPCEYFA